MGRAGHLRRRARRLTRLIGAGMAAAIALSARLAAIEMATRTRDARPRQRAQADAPDGGNVLTRITVAVSPSR